VLTSSSARRANREIETISLHDALPIYEEEDRKALQKVFQPADYEQLMNFVDFTESVSKMMQFSNLDVENPRYVMKDDGIHDTTRSEEHTSELQSRFDLVCRLLLEKKKT